MCVGNVLCVMLSCLCVVLCHSGQDIFISLIAVNFPSNVSKQNLRALFKQSNIVLFGRKFAYYHSAGACKNDTKVYVNPGDMGELLTAAASKKRMGAYKEGLAVQAPPEHTAWLESLVAVAISNEPIIGFQVRLESVLEKGEASMQEIHVKPTLMIWVPLHRQWVKVPCSLPMRIHPLLSHHIQ